MSDKQLEFDFGRYPEPPPISQPATEYFRKVFEVPPTEVKPLAPELEDQKRFNNGKTRMSYALAAPNTHQTMSLLGLYEYSSDEHNLLQCAHEFMIGFIEADTFVSCVSQLVEEMTGQRPADLYQQVAEFGEQKYDRGNFLKGAPISQYLDSWLRHFVKRVEGQQQDDESKCDHYAHLMWNTVEAARWVGHPMRDNRLVIK